VRRSVFLLWVAVYAQGRRDLRQSFDTLRLKTDKQASYHLQLAQTIRTDLESAAAAFCGRQAHHKKTFQTVIEKNWKAKQTQEAYVHKAREKYEQDCMRINAFTAQATLQQGKELERITLKLERAQQTVQANQRDFQNFARALGDTVRQWEVDWKAFCDSCQDLEEDRMEFMKDNLWAFANAVSTVCVSDDDVGPFVQFVAHLINGICTVLRDAPCLFGGVRAGARYGELYPGLQHRSLDPGSARLRRLQPARRRSVLGTAADGAACTVRSPKPAPATG
jgi:hypothetical protein